MSAFCTGCGAELADGAAFCTTCGTFAPSSSMTVPRPAAATPPPPPPPPAPAAPAAPPAPPLIEAALATPPKPPKPPKEPGRARRWLRSRRLLLLSRAFLALALLGSGITLGWLWASDRSLADTRLDKPVAEQPADESDADAVGIAMPDLRGLTTGQAQQVLADAGVPASRIKSVDQPAAGSPGVVIGQDPVYGQTVTGTVTITGSVAAKVPPIQGRSAEEVLDELDEFGAEVRRISRYVPGATVGSVVQIKPAPGTLLPVAVTVIIAAEPGELALASVDAEEYGCGSGDEQMNGKDYTGLISCSAYSEPETSAWLINRAASRLTATIGIPDSSGTGSNRAHLVIKGDGKVLGSYDVAYGRTQDIDVDVSGVLRLVLEYSSPDEDSTAVGLGNALLLGDQALLDPLDSSQ